MSSQVLFWCGTVEYMHSIMCMCDNNMISATITDVSLALISNIFWGDTVMYCNIPCIYASQLTVVCDVFLDMT